MPPLLADAASGIAVTINPAEVIGALALLLVAVVGWLAREVLKNIQAQGQRTETAVGRIETDMKGMTATMAAHGERIASLEARPGPAAGTRR